MLRRCVAVCVLLLAVCTCQLFTVAESVEPDRSIGGFYKSMMRSVVNPTTYMPSSVVRAPETLLNVAQLVAETPYRLARLNHLARIDLTAGCTLELLSMLDNAGINPQANASTIVQELLSAPAWAKAFLDAQAKPPPGILKGALLWFGDWDSCVDIDEILPIGGGHLEMNYCNVPLYQKGHVPPPFKNPAAVSYLSTINLGLCLPANCTNDDSATLLNLALSQIKMETAGPNIVCQEKTRHFTYLTKIAFSIIVIVVALVVVASAYDLAFILGDWKLRRKAERWEQRREGSSDGLGSSGELTSSTEEGGRPPRGGDPMQASASSMYDRMTGSDRHLQASAGVPQTVADYSPIDEDDDERLVAPTPAVEWRDTVWHALIVSLSAFRNGAKILTVSRKDTRQPLAFLHGIRAISLMWVMLGHHYLFQMSFADNLLSAMALIKRLTFQIVANGFFSVDTFFVLSGFLVTHLTLKALPKVKSWGAFFISFYVHRYIRLTPAYGMIILIYLGISPVLLLGPVWLAGADTTCINNWFSNLLYFNNFYNSDKQCIAWSWYLANDMQFYIISPIFILAYFYRPIIGVVLTFLLVLCHMISNGVLTAVDHTKAARFAGLLSLINGDNSSNTTVNADEFQEQYIKPYSRVGPYAIGMLLAFLIAKTKFRPRLPFPAVLVGWIVSVVLGFVLVYGFWPVYNGRYTLTALQNQLYMSSAQVLWGCIVAWVIFACSHRHCDVVRRLLSWAPLIVLSRLTFMAYLLHPIIFMVYVLAGRRGIHYYDVNQVWLFCGNLLVTYTVSFVLSVLFEAPFIALLKCAMPREERGESRPGSNASKAKIGRSTSNVRDYGTQRATAAVNQSAYQ